MDMRRQWPKVNKKRLSAGASLRLNDFFSKLSGFVLPICSFVLAYSEWIEIVLQKNELFIQAIGEEINVENGTVRCIYRPTNRSKRNKTHQKRDKVRAILFKINLEKPSFSLPEVHRP